MFLSTTLRRRLRTFLSFQYHKLTGAPRVVTDSTEHNYKRLTTCTGHLCPLRGPGCLSKERVGMHGEALGRTLALHSACQKHQLPKSKVKSPGSLLWAFSFAWDLVKQDIPVG